MLGKVGHRWVGRKREKTQMGFLLFGGGKNVTGPCFAEKLRGRDRWEERSKEGRIENVLQVT